MKSIHNINIFNTSPEEVIKIILQFKEEQGRLGKKTNDYSGLQATFANDDSTLCDNPRPTKNKK